MHKTLTIQLFQFVKWFKINKREELQRIFHVHWSFLLVEFNCFYCSLAVTNKEMKQFSELVYKKSLLAKASCTQSCFISLHRACIFSTAGQSWKLEKVKVSHKLHSQVNILKYIKLPSRFNFQLRGCEVLRSMPCNLETSSHVAAFLSIS